MVSVGRPASHCIVFCLASTLSAPQRPAAALRRSPQLAPALAPAARVVPSSPPEGQHLGPERPHNVQT